MSSIHKGLSSPLAWFWNRGPVFARASGQRTGRRNGGQVGKHSVCNFSRKYLWRMAATHCREPQEAIVAGLDSGRGEQNINCRTSVLLQWSERRRDAARWAEVSEMEREIKRWREGDKGALRAAQGERHSRTAGVGKKRRSVIKEPRFICDGQSHGDPRATWGAAKEPERTV